MLLDSNIIIYSAQPEHSIVREFLAHDDSKVSAISIVEVLDYPHLTPADEFHLRKVFSSLVVLTVSMEVIERAAKLRRSRLTLHTTHSPLFANA